VSYQQGRDSEDSQNLIGFDDIEGSVVTGGYVRSTIGDSPIVNANDGSKNGLLVAVSLSRSFDTNKWNW